MNIASRSVLILGFGFSVAACTAPGSTGNPLSGYSAQPLGNFQSAVQLDPNDTSFDTVGCTTPGTTTDAPQVDPRLTAGMVFDTSYGIQDGTTTVNLSLQNTIVAATSTTLVETMNVIGVTGDPNLQPGFTTTATYVLNADGSFPATYNPTPVDDPLPDSNCTLPSTSPTVAKYGGTFTTVTGISMPAQETVESTTGDITCNGQDFGNGTVSVTEIVSNNVPSEGSADFCGGVTVFLSLSEVAANGNLISGFSAERTVVPLVSGSLTTKAVKNLHLVQNTKGKRPLLRAPLRFLNAGLFR